MYYCSNCNVFFEEPSNYAEDRTPGGVFEGGSFIEHYSGCPHCGGGYEEAKRCACGEYIQRNARCCDTCRKNIIQRLIKEFDEDEYDILYDITEGKSYEDLTKEVI